MFLMGAVSVKQCFHMGHEKCSKEKQEERVKTTNNVYMQ